MVTNVFILYKSSISFAHSSFTTYLETTEAKETWFPFPCFLLTLRPGHALCRMPMFKDSKSRIWNFLKHKHDVLNLTVTGYHLLYPAEFWVKHQLSKTISRYLFYFKKITYFQCDLRVFMHCIFLLEVNIFFDKLT